MNESNRRKKWENVWKKNSITPKKNSRYENKSQLHIILSSEIIILFVELAQQLFFFLVFTFHAVGIRK